MALGRVLLAASFGLLLVCSAAAEAEVSGALRAHDPSRICRDGDRYFLYYTEEGVGSKQSTDLVHWTEGPTVFATPPPWTSEAVPGFRGKIWAPDVIRVKDKYFLYYSISTFGKQTSALGLATNTTLDPTGSDYKWVDEGIVLQSREGLPYNAIDPVPFWDSDGKLWLVWGSYWEGIHIAELDPATGKRLHPETPPVRLARQKAPSTDIEAAYLHKHGKYYLFVNFGSCCSGVKSTYNIRVGRGENPTGPFVDKDGVDLKDGGGTMFLEAEGRYIGPGHVGILANGDEELLSYHYYDGDDRGRSKFRIRRLEWGADGWPGAGDAP
jgi:arabinan endo-1,5-alpha-L-arabinosidase